MSSSRAATTASVSPLTSIAFALATTVSLACVGCGGKDKGPVSVDTSFSLDGGTPPPSCAPGQPCPPPSTGCAPGQPCPPPSNCAPGQPCPPPNANACPPGQVCNTLDPNMLAGLLAAGQAMLGQLGGDPVDLGIKAAAAKYAPGMSPEGQVAKGNLAEGGHVGFIVNMDPSKCYTIIGFGVGVQDLDVNLLAPPFYTMSTGQDGMAGPTAVIGAAPRPMCPIVPLSVPYKVDVYAKKGGGPVGAQVYAKPK